MIVMNQFLSILVVNSPFTFPARAVCPAIYIIMAIIEGIEMLLESSKGPP